MVKKNVEKMVEYEGVLVDGTKFKVWHPKGDKRKMKGWSSPYYEVAEKYGGPFEMNARECRPVLKEWREYLPKMLKAGDKVTVVGTDGEPAEMIVEEIGNDTFRDGHRVWEFDSILKHVPDPVPEPEPETEPEVCKVCGWIHDVIYNNISLRSRAKGDKYDSCNQKG